MKSFKEFIGLNEIFNQPYTYHLTRGRNSTMFYEFETDDESEVRLTISYIGFGDWTVEFRRNDSVDVTGEGDSFRIYATVLKILDEFYKEKSPESFSFCAEYNINYDRTSPNSFTSRIDLYRKLVSKFSKKYRYTYTEHNLEEDLAIQFNLTKVR